MRRHGGKQSAAHAPRASRSCRTLPLSRTQRTAAARRQPVHDTVRITEGIRNCDFCPRWYWKSGRLDCLRSPSRSAGAVRDAPPEPRMAATRFRDGQEARHTAPVCGAVVVWVRIGFCRSARSSSAPLSSTLLLRAVSRKRAAFTGNTAAGRGAAGPHPGANRSPSRSPPGDRFLISGGCGVYTTSCPVVRGELTGITRYIEEQKNLYRSSASVSRSNN